MDTCLQVHDDQDTALCVECRDTAVHEGEGLNVRGAGWSMLRLLDEHRFEARLAFAHRRPLTCTSECEHSSERGMRAVEMLSCWHFMSLGHFGIWLACVQLTCLSGLILIHSFGPLCRHCPQLRPAQMARIRALNNVGGLAAIRAGVMENPAEFPRAYRHLMNLPFNHPLPPKPKPAPKPKAAAKAKAKPKPQSHGLRIGFEIGRQRYRYVSKNGRTQQARRRSCSLIPVGRTCSFVLCLLFVCSRRQTGRPSAANSSVSTVERDAPCPRSTSDRTPPAGATSSGHSAVSRMITIGRAACRARSSRRSRRPRKQPSSSARPGQRRSSAAVDTEAPRRALCCSSLFYTQK